MPFIQAATRRGVPSVNQAFGNKLAVLGGDFLLSRASISLARLRNLEVTKVYEEKYESGVPQLLLISKSDTLFHYHSDLYQSHHEAQKALPRLYLSDNAFTRLGYDKYLMCILTG